MKDLFQKIIQSIERGESLSPFLFLGNLNESKLKIEDLTLELLKQYGVPQEYFFKIENSSENIKIEEIKKIISLGNIKSSFTFQVFFIENISRLTLGASNSSLKFLEEPGFGNIIFLSSPSESGILDTILSRVQNIYLSPANTFSPNEEYLRMIRTFINSKNPELLSYFGSAKLEKNDYREFLVSLIYYIKENTQFSDFLEDLETDLNAIEQNNVNGKYVVDKWIAKIG